MSHFTVAVFTDPKGATVDELLAPFVEEVEAGDEYAEFEDITADYKDKYENETLTKVKAPDGTLYDPFDDKFRIKDSNGFYNDKKIPEDYVEVEVPIKELFSTFDEYMNKWCGYQYDQHKRGYGYWSNPNAKWDWYQVGGRWEGSLLTKSGNNTDSWLVNDIDWKSMMQNDIEGLGDTYDKFCNSKDGIDRYFSDIRDGETKEHYINRKAGFQTYAVVTPDGVWHSKGDMGWFGMSSETEEEADKWSESFYDTFVKGASDDMMITIVDCHI